MRLSIDICDNIRLGLNSKAMMDQARLHSVGQFRDPPLPRLSVRRNLSSLRGPGKLFVVRTFGSTRGV